MSRSFIGMAAAMALLGSGYASRPAVARATDDWDDETRLKREALAEASKREKEARREEAMRRRQAARDRELERQRKERADFDALRNGIEPTTGQPLSRQRRRALSRQNFPFIAIAGGRHCPAARR